MKRGSRIEQILSLQREGLTQKEIARVLGVGPSTVWSALHPKRSELQRLSDNERGNKYVREAQGAIEEARAAYLSAGLAVHTHACLNAASEALRAVRHGAELTARARKSDAA